MKVNLFLFLKKAVSHVSAFYVCQPIMSNLFILIILNLVTVSFDFYLAFTAPDEGEFCLTEILGNKIITLLSCPISLAIGFLFYSTLLILIYTKIRLHLATVCPSGPCIELPHFVGVWLVFGCFTFIKIYNIKNILCQPRLHADRSRDPS